MAILGLSATKTLVFTDIVGLLQENANDCHCIMSTYETKQTIMVVLGLQPAKCNHNPSQAYGQQKANEQICYRYKKIKQNKLSEL